MVGGDPLESDGPHWEDFFSLRRPPKEHVAPKKHLPGEPVACSYGLLSVNYGLLWGIVACCFGLLGCPGMYHVEVYLTCLLSQLYQEDGTMGIGNS